MNMDPLPPTPMNRLMASTTGIAVGVGVQMLFIYLVTHVIGPIPDGLNIKLVEWLLLLVAPSVLSLLFLRVDPGSVSEEFFKGFQLGAIVWFLVGLTSSLFFLH